MVAVAMACSASAGMSMSCRSGDEVYVAAVPLRASKGPSQLLMSAAYSLNFQHFMVIIKTSQSHHHHLVYDFQPEDPENIWLALAALSGRKVPGVILVRELRKLPTTKCWFVGYSKLNAMDAAPEFNRSWDTDLIIGHHDCRNYSQELVEYLTGNKPVLEHLGKHQTIPESSG